MKATELLKRQHGEVKALLGKAKQAKPGKRRELIEEIAEKLQLHMMVEEDIFYPAVRALDTKTTDELVPEAYEEHHVVKLVLAELPEVDLEDEQFEAKVTVLSELVEHHVKEEEAEMFKSAEKLGTDRLSELGEEMEIAAAADADPSSSSEAAR